MALASAVGCPNTDSVAMVTCLRSVDEMTLLQVQDSVNMILYQIHDCDQTFIFAHHLSRLDSQDDSGMAFVHGMLLLQNVPKNYISKSQKLHTDFSISCQMNQRCFLSFFFPSNYEMHISLHLSDKCNTDVTEWQ